MSFPYLESATITLYKNVPFSNKYSHHPFIEDFNYNGKITRQSGIRDFLELKKSTGKKYFDSIVYSDVNFNCGNSLVTTITLEIDYEFTTSNYMQVYFPNQGKQLYYFITDITQLNSLEKTITCKLNLELDVLSTYGGDLLRGLSDIPIRAKRKHDHRFAQNTTIPKFYCCDLVLDEPVFSGLKPSLLKQRTDIPFIIPNGVDSYDIIKVGGKSNILWAYFLCNTRTSGFDMTYKINGVVMNGVIACIPLRDGLKYMKMLGSDGKEYNINIEKAIESLIGSGYTFGCKVSPYPPFSSLVNPDNTIVDVYYTRTDNAGDTIVFSNTKKVELSDEHLRQGVTYSFGNSNLAYEFINSETYKANAFFVIDECFTDGKNYYNHLEVTLEKPSSKPISTTLRSKIYEPKLYVTPCTQYLLTSQYGKGVEYPYQIDLSSNTRAFINDEYDIINFKTYATPEYNDQTLSTYFSYLGGGSVNYDGYKDNNYGLVATPNYTRLWSRDAVDYFSATQSQSFAVGKIASGVMGALAIAGGIALGVASVPSGGATATLTPAMIKAGMTGVGGALAVGNSISSSVAKYVDLTNTPDTLSSSGGNFVHDLQVNGLQPYFIINTITNTEQEMMLDYFYNFGYTCERDCYFNFELKDSNYVASGYIDNNLFTRTTFNYIELEEDITDKIHSDIPPVCKEKIASIFSNGIKLYTLLNLDIESGYLNNLYDYYENNKYENVEVDIYYEEEKGN